MPSNTAKPPAGARAVLDYWFGGTEVDGRKPAKRWFAGGKAVDAAIDRRFGARVLQALDGRLEHWPRSAGGRVALIVLLDQFPRNLYRGRARAFAGDDRARRLTLAGLRRGDDNGLSVAECGFFYMPLEHSERLDDQNRSVTLQEALLERAPPTQRKLAASFLRHARAHRGVIVRFGRFPHRNAVLGRTDTDAEAAYLKHAPRYGQ